MGQDFEPNQAFFDSILRSSPVQQLVDDAAGTVLGNAVATAPVDRGDYKDGLHIEHHESKYRRVARVVGSDPKTMIIESRTGNLARALKKASS